jgi:hypothetical protein
MACNRSFHAIFISRMQLTQKGPFLRNTPAVTKNSCCLLVAFTEGNIFISIIAR